MKNKLESNKAKLNKIVKFKEDIAIEGLKTLEKVTQIEIFNLYFCV